MVLSKLNEQCNLKAKADQVVMKELNCLPKHVAVIMDGNGRWAQARGKPRLWGHRKGLDSVRAIVKTAKELSIEILSLYAFSDENWGRPQSEISGIFKLLDYYLATELDVLREQRVRLRVIGALAKLPLKIRKRVIHAQEVLSVGDGLQLNVALSYGARNEIVEACKNLASKAASGILKPKDIDIETVAAHLWTKGLRDPDLLIRTSGEQRLSNFLLWQMAYTELFFSQVCWPDFGREEFLQVLYQYQERNRRFGKLNREDQELADV